MTKFPFFLLAIPIFSMGQKFSHQVELHGGTASTVFQNKFEKTYNANPNGVWKPSFGLDFNWFRDGEPGLTFGLGINYAYYGMKIDASYGQRVAEIITNEEAKISYLQVPLEIGYHKQLSKIDVCTSLGIAPSFLADYNYEFTWADGSFFPVTFTIPNAKSNIDARAMNILRDYWVYIQGTYSVSECITMNMNF